MKTPKKLPPGNGARPGPPTLKYKRFLRTLRDRWEESVPQRELPQAPLKFKPAFKG